MWLYSNLYMNLDCQRRLRGYCRLDSGYWHIDTGAKSAVILFTTRTLVTRFFGPRATRLFELYVRHLPTERRGCFCLEDRFLRASNPLQGTGHKFTFVPQSRAPRGPEMSITFNRPTPSLIGSPKRSVPCDTLSPPSFREVCMCHLHLSVRHASGQFSASDQWVHT
ncbi:hypothetical protein BC834DRAFT_261258 [Gloeopeniophorella convolvens]|nr:hypothetical protein BC834DRAFT_261258 [Gloeopeniophorella convolvens]